MSYLHILILALVQGAAELLPVSSSAHVILAQHWLGLDPSRPEMVFLLVMLHTGTMGAVLLYFRHRWLALFRKNTKYLLKIIGLATGATLVLGFVLKIFIEKFILGGGHAEVEDLFKSRPAVASALAAAGVLILVSGWLFQGRASKREDKSSMTPSPKALSTSTSLTIGLVQGLCLPFRGFSRSGATISTGLLLGVPRALAEDFSFLLAVVITPPVIVRSVWKLVKALHRQGSPVSDLMYYLPPGLFGAAFAFLSGFLALRFLSHVLERGRWWIFGFYCFLVAGVMYFGG